MNKFFNLPKFKNKRKRFNKDRNSSYDKRRVKKVSYDGKFFKNKELIRLISVGEGIKPVEQIKNFDLEKSSLEILYVIQIKMFSFMQMFILIHKILYYISDVSEEDALFMYCKKSHKNNFQRMWYELKRGQLEDSHKDSYRIENHLDKKYFANYFKKL